MADDIAISWKALAQRPQPELRSYKGAWPPPRPAWQKAKDWVDNEVLSRVPWWLRVALPIPESTSDWMGWADAAVSATPQRAAAKMAALPFVALRSERGRRLLKDILGFDLTQPIEVVRVQLSPPVRKDGKLLFAGSTVRDAVFAVPVRHGNVDAAIDQAVTLSSAPPMHVLRGKVRVTNPLLVGESSTLSDTLGKLDKDAATAIDVLDAYSRTGLEEQPATINWAEVARGLQDTARELRDFEYVNEAARLERIADKIPYLRGRNFVARKYAQAFKHHEADRNMGNTLDLVLPDPLAARRAWHAGFDAVIPFDIGYVPSVAEIALKSNWSDKVKVLDKQGKPVYSKGKQKYRRVIGYLVDD